ncbi:MAG: glycine cleavage system aminomethyltransferase GcvT [Planctomycetes bacterium]|nr:glycine cleavage system aminomethyltransferase GcvT [Planctomycetota bacterium]
MSTTDLLRTPLHDWHVAHGGRMIDFAGWSMPVQYTSITDEYYATRNAVGVFDISHMGRLQFFGTAAAAFLDSVVTRRVTDLKPDQVRYGLVCNELGGILDDVLLYGGTADGVRPYAMVVNASNREKIVDWLREQLPAWQQRSSQRDALSIGDVTLQTAMIAVQGRKAIEVLASFFRMDSSAPALDLGGMRYYHYDRGYFAGNGVTVSRTGYTGEDGIEIICDRDIATDIWDGIVEAAAQVGGMAAGLGARDTLRLEAAMPLYGHELSEAINPIQAGLSFAVNLSGRDFVGRDVLERFSVDKTQPVRIGLHVEGKRVPRQGCPVLQSSEIVGEVTSGTFSPTFERPIAMAYVRPTAQAVGTRLAVDIRGTQHAATVVPLPFYDRGRKN